MASTDFIRGLCLLLILLTNFLETDAAECKPLEWPCVTQEQCIEQFSICDGHVDCKDGSDETFHLCSNTNITCPEYAFRCTYGGCIDGDARCDGVKDCADNSDELMPGCKGIEVEPKNHNCGANQFPCLKGNECIPFDEKCDGVANCKDGSDETITQCADFPCPEFAFRCSYGGCVDGDSMCDGQKQCADGSDEFAPQCKVVGAPPRPGFQKPQTTLVIPTFSNGTGFCTLPKPPENGFYSSSSCEPGSSAPECNAIVGTKVGYRFNINYGCYEGFSIKGNVDQFCGSSGWFPRDRPTCSDMCDPLVSAKLQIYCFDGNKKPLPCDKPLPTRSFATFRCREATHYKEYDIGYSRINCANGRWDRDFTDSFCRAACGKAVFHFAAPFIVHGQPVKFGSFPWHVALYELKKGAWTFACGGSLISLELVLTAAHCVKEEIQGKRGLVNKDSKVLRIGVGKLYIGINDPREQSSEIFDVEKVIPSPDYQGAKDNHKGDIAIILIKGSVSLSPAVQTVCLDLGPDNIEEKQLVPGTVGLVPGWGKTEDKTPSDELLVAKIPFVSQQQCLEDTELYNFVTWDKMCGGDFKTKQTVCSGDSGGGYVFEDPDKKTFYLRGIVSAGSSRCTGEEYALFTRISKYSDFINHQMSQYT